MYIYIYIYTYMVYMYLFMHIYICTLYINLYPSPFLVHVTNSCKLSLSNHQPSPPSKQKSRLRFTSKWSCHRAFSWSLWVSMEGLHRVAQDHSSTFQQTCVFFGWKTVDLLSPLPEKFINVWSCYFPTESDVSSFYWDSDTQNLLGHESQDAKLQFRRMIL